MTHLTPADLDRLDALVAERATIRTHAENCYLWDDHRDCAIRRLAAEICRLWAEVAEIDDVIGGRGVPERDCTLPLPERVDNIIVELKNWRHSSATEAMENEKLRAENERLLAVRDQLHNWRVMEQDDGRAWTDGYLLGLDRGIAALDAARGGA